MRNENELSRLSGNAANCEAESEPLFQAEEILHCYLFALKKHQLQDKMSPVEVRALEALSRLQESGCPGRERLFEILSDLGLWDGRPYT
jgi:hypothetical protein